MKKTSPRGSRARWTSLALAAPIAAVSFFGSVAFAVNAPTSVAQTQSISTPLTSATPVAARTSATSPAHVTAKQTATKPSAAPKVHASTGASGATRP